MTAKLQEAFVALSTLPEDRQDELAEALIGMTMPVIDYTSPAFEAALDRSIAQAEAGDYASQEQVEATFAKFR